jgi:hypothetical protein
MRHKKPIELTADVQTILSRLNGEDGLKQLKIDHLENFGRGLMFRLYGFDGLDLKAVVAVEPEGELLLISVQYANARITFEEIRVESDGLFKIIQEIRIRALSD